MEPKPCCSASLPVQGTPAGPHGLALKLSCVQLDFFLPKRLYHTGIESHPSWALQSMAVTHSLEKGELTGLSICAWTSQGTSVLTTVALAQPHTPDAPLCFWEHPGAGVSGRQAQKHTAVGSGHSAPLPSEWFPHEGKQQLIANAVWDLWASPNLRKGLVLFVVLGGWPQGSSQGGYRLECWGSEPGAEPEAGTEAMQRKALKQPRQNPAVAHLFPRQGPVHRFFGTVW